MFRALLCPSSGEQDCVLPHMVFSTGCAGCDCVELENELCAVCESLMINIRLVALLVSLSSPYVHDAQSQEPKTQYAFI